MKIISPSVEILQNINYDYILKHLEVCARNCYKSEGNITEDNTSAIKMVKKLIELNHTAMLEHYNITVKLICDIGAYKDLTRHRHASFAIESTRYCNYAKDKFGNELTFIKPCNIEELSPIWNEWISQMKEVELTYREMAKLGAKPDQLRLILPHSTASSVVMTSNIREWRYILNLRCAKFAHPSVREIMLLLLSRFYFMMPVLFEDIFEQFFTLDNETENTKTYILKDRLSNNNITKYIFFKDNSECPVPMYIHISGEENENI